MSSLTRVWLLMFLVNAPVYLVLGWIMFGNWEAFWEGILSSIYGGDSYVRAKTVIWFFLPIGLIRGELWLLGL